MKRNLQVVLEYFERSEVVREHAGLLDPDIGLEQGEVASHNSAQDPNCSISVLILEREAQDLGAAACDGDKIVLEELFFADSFIFGDRSPERGALKG